MPKFFIFFLIFIGVVIVLLAGIVIFGKENLIKLVVLKISKPKYGIELSSKLPSPDYARPESWAALPDRKDLADLVPKGITTGDRQADAPVDVFFIHPTGYLHGNTWNSSMDPNSSTEENTQWMMANQASAFNGCGRVFAPRYREAILYSFISDDKEQAEKAIDFAYKDVEAAFDYFLEHFSRGRPFIIASHSQGTWHALKLLEKRIDRTDLVQRLVAAYIIGGQVTVEKVERMADIKACKSSTDLHCVVHWKTFAEGGKEDRIIPNETFLCTNPLSWKVNNERVAAEFNRGAVLPTGKFNLKLWGKDKAKGTVFGPLDSPIPRHTWAQCQSGLLYVAKQTDKGFSRFGAMKNYHGLDYALFYMDIRENAIQRVKTYLEGRRNYLN
jgi:hypothetical protein